MKRFDEMTGEDIHQLYRILRTDPHRFLQLAQEYIRRFPEQPEGYDTRGDAWEALGYLDRALQDFSASLSRRPSTFRLERRARVFRRLGRYQEAIDDFNRSEAMAPDQWGETFAPLYRADCHACLGNTEAALADCERLSSDHWTPGMDNTPSGNKEAVIEEIKRRARAARRLSS